MFNCPCPTPTLQELTLILLGYNVLHFVKLTVQAAMFSSLIPKLEPVGLVSMLLNIFICH